MSNIPYVDHTATWALHGMVHFKTALAASDPLEQPDNLDHRVMNAGAALAFAKCLLVTGMQAMNQNRRADDPVDASATLNKIWEQVANELGFTYEESK